MLAELSITIAIALVCPRPQKEARLETAGRANPRAIKSSTAIRTAKRDRSSTYFAPAGPLHAHPEEPQRAEPDLPGLLAVDQVHEDRNQSGERGQQEERGGEGHSRVRFSR